MDELVEKLGLDFIEFRFWYIIKCGEGSFVFKALGEGKLGVD